jgi:uncharacterized protein YhaN
VAALLQAAKVQAPAGEIAPEAAEAALTTLWQAIAQAATAAERRCTLDQQITELDTLVRERTASVAALAEDLAALRASAGASDDAAVHALDAQWTQLQELIEQRRAIDDEVRAGAHVAVADLITLLGSDDAAMSVRIERLTERIEALEGEQRAAKLERDALVVSINELQTSTALADANEQRAAALARIEELMPALRRLAVQEQLLREYIDTQARESRGPLIKRAGEYFARITCGELTGIEIDRAANDELVLVAVPAEGDTNIRVDGLSEGTIDQLYLALRLAAIALEHESGGEPMPLIVDDVLASFDNDRARATLALFADLGAAGIQILFLTHHQHLVDIAGDELAPDALTVLDIGAVTGTSGVER